MREKYNIGEIVAYSFRKPILAENAKSGCCNSGILKYNDGRGQSWPVCNICFHAFSNAVMKLI